MRDTVTTRTAAMTGNHLHEDAERARRPRLDVASRVTVFRFIFNTGLIFILLAPQRDRLSHGTMAIAVLGAAAMTGLLALVFREPLRGPSLNRWDETLAYLGVAALMRVMS